MRRELVCADKWRGKEIVYLPHSPRRSAQKHHFTHTSNANRFKTFHHVDLPDYLILETLRNRTATPRTTPGEK